MNVAQIVAIVIFVVMFAMIIMDKIERHIITLVSGLLVLVVVFGLLMHSGEAVYRALNVQSLMDSTFWYGKAAESTSGVNWSTILFLAGMMVMVEGLNNAGFFRWLCLLMAKKVHYRNVPLLICFLCMSAVMAMFIDSITVILFLATVTIELSRILNFDPVPMIIAEIFCANLGGSATMCGDPPNIIIGTAFGFSFADFLTNTGVIAGISFLVMVLYFWLCLRNELRRSEQSRDPNAVYPDPNSAITDKKAFVFSAAVFVLAVVLLITHAQTELSVACIGVIVAVITTIGTILISGTDSVREIYHQVDYKTLLFFIGLFLSVEGLDQTGVLEVLANLIGTLGDGKPAVIIAIILWLSAIASALVDNIPFAATMVPVVRLISIMQIIPLPTLAWTLSLGTDLGGNATPIGASANVVGVSVAEREGHHIGWGRYCKYTIPATIIVLMMCTAWMILVYL
ncbi:MAG: SLC13 family permease [Butyricicoccus sp.]